MSDHVHSWVLVNTYDSHAIKPKTLHIKTTFYGGIFGGRVQTYDNESSLNGREDVRSIIERFSEPHYTSETWACECGERKTNHHEEPSVTQRILNDTKSEEKPS